MINAANTSHQAINSMFVDLFLNKFNHQVLFKAYSVQKEKIEKFVKVKSAETEVLEILADITLTQQSNDGYDYLSDQLTIQKLLDAKTIYSESIFNHKIYESAIKELDETHKQYRRYIRLMRYHWYAGSQMVPKRSVLFPQYHKVLSQLLNQENFSLSNPDAQREFFDAIDKTAIIFFFGTSPTDEVVAEFHRLSSLFGQLA